MKKIGIMTFHRALNYGAVLQAYALQKTVTRLGAECELVDYICPKITHDYKPFRVEKKGFAKSFAKSVVMCRRRAQRAKAFRPFFDNFLVKSDISYTPETLPQSKSRYDLFITGSDQVWSPRCAGFDPAYFLTFADSAQKYSYAASFAVSTLPDEQIPEYKERLKDFQAYSVREKSGVKLVKELTGNDAVTHLDPSLLLGSEEWNKIAVRKIDTPYVLIVSGNPPYELIQSAEKLAKKKNLPIYQLWDAPKLKKSDIKHIVAPTVEEFVGCFKYADYVFTNSFHGTAFSVIFNKNLFVEFKHKAGRNIRAEELLKAVGINRNITETGITETPIDWDDVNSRIKNLQLNSLSYLKSIIE